MSYSFNKVTKICQVRFTCQWPVNVKDIGYVYETSLGKFTIGIKKVGDSYAFTISTEWTDVAKLSEFQSCAVEVEDHTRLSFSKVKFVPKNKIRQHVTSIPCNQLSPANEKFYLFFRFSSSDRQDDPQPTLADTILENLYCDTTYGDVSFMFDSATNPLSARKAPKKKGGKKPTKAQQKKMVLHAHKLVLSQWPYFKAMFEGGFAEGEPGVQRINILDTKLRTFKLLLRFLYTGQLPVHLGPTIMYSDELEDIEDASMEDLFLAADRYDIQALQDLTLEPLLESLDADNAIPFLFRTAYKFPELRKPVMQFVAKSCGMASPRKNIRNKYRDHPDVFDILVDLFDEYEELAERSKDSKRA
ncbi:hypothetical protein BGZ81_004963 [Podila clonocystis]|nr:hypothetical protein BGZ81_004963 [Podila clonocystis]